MVYNHRGDYTNDSGRSYAQAELTAPLQAGCVYRITFFVRLAKTWEFSLSAFPPIASSNLGALLSVGRVLQPNGQALLASPQITLPPGQLITDTVNYVPVTGLYTAQGGERYLTLGNFLPDAATVTRRLNPAQTQPSLSRYAIDDVSVVPVLPGDQPFDLGPDLLLCDTLTSRVTLTAPAGYQGYQWSTGATTPAITVQRPGRYSVTGTFACGTAADTVRVSYYDPARLRLLPPRPVALCPGETYVLAATPGFQDYQWADGPTGRTRTIGAPGRYRLRARTADGCAVADSIDIGAELPPRLPRLPADTLLCAGETLTLRVPAPLPGQTYEWPDATTGTSFTLRRAGIFELLVRNRCQTATATVRVQTRDCADLLIPNVITPNHDGRNDSFRIVAPSPRPLRLSLYDRWGRLVYETAEYRNNWQAEGLPAGVYYYLVTDTRYNRRYRGWLEVIR